jgi:hypothetical protein
LLITGRVVPADHSCTSCFLLAISSCFRPLSRLATYFSPIESTTNMSVDKFID